MLESPGLFKASRSFISEACCGFVELVACGVVRVIRGVVAFHVKGLLAPTNFGLTVPGHVALRVGIRVGSVDGGELNASGDAFSLVLCPFVGGGVLKGCKAAVDEPNVGHVAGAPKSPCCCAKQDDRLMGCTDTRILL